MKTIIKRIMGMLIIFGLILAMAHSVQPNLSITNLVLNLFYFIGSLGIAFLGITVVVVIAALITLVLAWCFLS